MVGAGGIEPPLQDPQPRVLPLYYAPVLCGGASGRVLPPACQQAGYTTPRGNS